MAFSPAVKPALWVYFHCYFRYIKLSIPLRFKTLRTRWVTLAEETAEVSCCNLFAQVETDRIKAVE